MRAIALEDVDESNLMPSRKAIAIDSREVNASRDMAESRLESLFTDDAALAEVSARPSVKLAMQASPLNDKIVKQAALGAYLSHQLKREVSPLEYPSARDGVARAEFGKENPSDEEMFALVRGKFEWKKKKNAALNDLYFQVVAKTLEGAAAGRDTTAISPIFQAWGDAHPDLRDGENDLPFLAGALRMHRKTLADLESVKESAAAGLDLMRKFTTGKASNEDVLNFAGILGKLTPDDRQKSYKYITLAAQAGQVDRAGVEQFAKNFGELVSRSFDFIPKGNLASMEDWTQSWLDSVQSGNVHMRDGENFPRLGADDLPGNRPLTDEEREMWGKKFSDALPAFQVARELKAVARDGVDPTRPVFDEGTFAGTVERGAYGLAGSTGLIAATAINPMLGVMAYQDEIYDRLLVENPDMNRGAAKMLSFVEASGNAALDKLQINAIMGRLPILGNLLNKVKSDGWRRVLKIGGNIVEQNVQEGVQDLIAPVLETITAAIREDMPDKDFGKLMSDYAGGRAETFFAVLPLALIGGGVATVQDIKDPARVLTSDALRQAGFSEEQRADIQSATSEEEFRAKVEAQWKKRTPENIASGKVEIEAAADAASAEGSVDFDGKNFNVTDPEGNLILSTPDADAAAVAAADIKSSRELEDLAEVRSMIAFYERDNMEQGRADEAQRFEQTGEDPKLSDAGESFSKLMERMQIEGIAPGTDPRTVSILGENIGELKNGIFSDLIKLHSKANAMTVVHERIDGETKRAIAEGRRSRDWFVKNVQQAEGALGEVLLVTDADGRVSDQSVVEAVTKLGEAYFAGRVRDDRLPPGLRRFFREMVQYFKELFRRAGRMRKAITEEKISGDFVEYLADSVGLPLEARADRAAREYEAEMLAEYREMIGEAAQGAELLDAIRNGGGLPAEGSKFFDSYAGELLRVRDSIRGQGRGAHVGNKGLLVSSIFKKDAFDPDVLLTSLQGQGFDFKTPDDLFNALEERFLTGEDMFGYKTSEAMGYERTFSIAPAGVGIREISEKDVPDPVPILDDPFAHVASSLTLGDWGREWKKWLQKNSKKWKSGNPIDVKDGEILISGKTSEEMRKVSSNEDARLHYIAATRLPELLKNSVLKAVETEKKGKAGIEEVHRRYAWADFPDGKRRGVLLTVFRWKHEAGKDFDTAYSEEVTLEVERPAEVTPRRPNEGQIPASAGTNNLAQFLSIVKPQHKNDFRIAEDPAGGDATSNGISGAIPLDAKKPVGETGKGSQAQSSWRPASDRSRQNFGGPYGVPAEKVFEGLTYEPARAWGLSQLADLFQTDVAPRDARYRIGPPIYRSDYKANRTEFDFAAEMAWDAYVKTLKQIDDFYADHPGTPHFMIPRTPQARALFTDASGKVHLIDHTDGQIELKPGQPTFSIADNAKVFAMQSALARLRENPKERLDIYERAKARIERVMTQNRASIDAMKSAGKKKVEIERARLVNMIGEFEAVLSVMPPEVRGRIGGFKKLAEFKTETARLRYFADRMEQIGDALEYHLRREYSERITNVLERARPKAGDSGVRRSTLGPEAQDIANMALKASLMDEDATSTALSVIEGMLSDPNISPDREATLREEWGIINQFGDLENRPASTLADALKFLTDTFRQGRSARRMQEEVRIAKMQMDRSQIIRALKDGTTQGIQRARARESKLAAWAASYTFNHQSFAGILENILPPESADLVSDWQKEMRKADNGSQTMEIQANQAIREVIRNAAGTRGFMAEANAVAEFKRVVPDTVPKMEGFKVKNERISIELGRKIVRGEANPSALSKRDIETLRKELESLPRDSRKEFVDIRRVIFNGKMEKVDLSRDEAVQLLLAWDQLDVREKMRMDGWRDESIEAMRDLTDDDPVSQAVLSFLRDFYRKNRDVVNPVYSRMFGMNMPMVKNYAPSRFEHSNDTQDVGPDGTPMSAGGTPGFARSRVSHASPVKVVGALSVYQQHVVQTAHWVNFAEFAREFRGVVKNLDVRRSVEQTRGQKALEILDNWLDLLENRGGRKSNEIRVLNKFMASLAGGKAISSLGFNPRTIAMQMDSMMRFIFAMPGKDIASALADFQGVFAAVPKAWHSQTVQNRIMGGASPEVKWLYERGAVNPSMLSKVGELAMLPIQYADAGLTSLSSAIVYRDAHARAKADGANDTQAEAIAVDAMDDAVYRYSQPVGFGAKSLIENTGGPAQRLFMMFLSDARLKTGILIDAVDGLRTGRGNPADHVRRIVGVFAMAMLSQTVSNFYRDALTGDDDEEIWTWQGYLKAAALAPLSGLFLAGTGAEIVISMVLGEKSFTPGRDPLSDAVIRGTRAVKNIDDVFNFDDPSAMLREWDNIFRSLALSPAMAAPAVLLNPIKPLLGLAKNIEKED